MATNNENVSVKTYSFAIRIYPQSYFTLNVIHLNSLTVFEAGFATLDNQTLLVQHSELKPSEIIMNLTVNPNYGHLKKGQNESSQWTTRLSITQQDINDGYVLYENTRMPPMHQNNKTNHSEFTDELVFDIGNEIVKMTNLQLDVTIVPKLITLIVANMTVSEGGMVILKTDNLHVSHAYYDTLIDEFIVVEEPKFGTIFSIEQNDIKLSSKSFTREQLMENKICYQQDSSEVQQDWFTIVARSNRFNKESAPATVHITIEAVNDEAPRIVNNTGIHVWSGQSAVISNCSLAALDDDSSPQEIEFVIYMPTNGYLVNSDKNVTTNRFTQADVDANKIRFVHVGQEGDGSFKFHVSDGKNHGISNVFHVHVKTHQLVVKTNEKMVVMLGRQQSLTRNHLEISTNKEGEEDENREFIIKIVKAPSYGSILLEDLENKNILRPTQFSQQQINEHLVFYSQDVVIDSPVVVDTVIFNVESPNLATLQSVPFFIEIVLESVQNIMATNVFKLLVINGLLVEEGQFSFITTKEINLKRLLDSNSNLANKLHLQLLQNPAHGVILKNGINVNTMEMVSYEFVQNRSLIYKHDNSNTYNDSVLFSLVMFNEFSVPLANFTLPVDVIAVNDEFPVVINQSPTLQAISSSRTPVTNATLLAKDNDDQLTSLLFQIKPDSINPNARTNGFFSYEYSDNAIYQFSQAEINENKIYFTHQGSGQAQLTFWFRVVDDKNIVCDSQQEAVAHYEQPYEMSAPNSHCTPYYPLKVVVSQLTLQLVNHSIIQLPQGSFQTLITRSHLATKSKQTSPQYIVYRIRNQPDYGYISVNNKISLEEFNQKQIDEGQVMYVQVKHSPEDVFSVDVVQHDNVFNEKAILNVAVRIQTKPMIKAQKPFMIATPGSQSLVSYEFLDAR